MVRARKPRRAAHGSAWHWRQTDCWYYTLPGTKRRVSLLDENGERIRGRENREVAEEALARIRLSGDGVGNRAPADEEWLTARVCSEYLQYCERRVKASGMSRSHLEQAKAFLNDLCRYCGALPVAELKKSHVQTWLDGHSGWKSPATHRSVLAIVLAAFNQAEELHGVASPLKGMKKPRSQPRLQSFTAEEEQSLYGATEECFRNFLFAAVHTGLRPFCELAKVTADHVELGERGMMWRVYSSKTKKTRKIPIAQPVAELAKKLMLTAPRGSGKPLFRNTQGNAWRRMTGVVRFLALKKKLGWDLDPQRNRLSCYTARHTFAHRMLSGYWNGGVGCSIETLAELMGDTPSTAYQHYGKEWALSYQEPLWAAIGVAKPAARARPQRKAR